MQNSKNGGGSAGKGRNAKGQWLPGTSGNGDGRPPKTRAVSKDLAEHIADALEEMVPSTNAQGKREKVTRAKAISRQLVRSFPAMKLTEQLSALRYMDKLGVFAEARKRSVDRGDHLTREQVEERVLAMIQCLKEQHGPRE